MQCSSLCHLFVPHHFLIVQAAAPFQTQCDCKFLFTFYLTLALNTTTHLPKRSLAVFEDFCRLDLLQMSYQKMIDDKIQCYYAYI